MEDYIMNFLESLKSYGESFTVTDSRDFDPEELASVKSAKVVASQYGMSCCFYMKKGGQKYIPLSRDAQACIGDDVDLTKAKLLTLSNGDTVIPRVLI